MATNIFDFPVMEFFWYGTVSLMSLWRFASLSFEVKRGADACRKAEDEDACKVVWTTYHVNFIAMVVANLVFIAVLFGLCLSRGSEWRAYFSASIFACGAYWFYTSACEKKLIAFLRQVDVYPQRYRQA